MRVLTRSDLTSALIFDAPFGTDRVSNDLVATEGGFVVPKNCSIDGCSDQARGRGWCGKHWQRWRKFGDPLATQATLNVVGTTGECTHPKSPKTARCWACYVASAQHSATTSIEARWWSKVDVDGRAIWLLKNDPHLLSVSPKELHRTDVGPPPKCPAPVEAYSDERGWHTPTYLGDEIPTCERLMKYRPGFWCCYAHEETVRVRYFLKLEPMRLYDDDDNPVDVLATIGKDTDVEYREGKWRVIAR